MNILLIGGGGREHALAWKIAQSPLCARLWCAPGNAGIAEICETVALDAGDHAAVVEFCVAQTVDFVVVGPEQPLVGGLVDALDAAGIKAFGPGAKAAQLEGSKGFTKDLCARAGIPTAAYQRFTDAASARAYLDGRQFPIVIKADGLAAGKGVIIADDADAANAAIDDMFGGSFGGAGAEVVVEDFLRGEEVSVFALVDGESALILASAQDHKRAFDGDTGPNTGGMGAYSPAPVLSDRLAARVMDEVIMPTVRTMAADGTPYRGVLYAGLMITDNGPELIEYNVRFGDPECQVLMMRLKSDIVPALLATATGTLGACTLDWHDEAALTLVLAAKGYPGTPAKGGVIAGSAAPRDDLLIFHAGTRRRDDGALIADGGRVLSITARGNSVRAARDKAYGAAEKISWPDGFYRTDIGWRAIARES